MEWKIINLHEVNSTNTYIYKVPGTDVVVTTDYQSAGRGQAGNHWESERGKNLLFSVKVSPYNVPAKSQYVLSMAGALALKAVLDRYSEGFTLKWPNDIYWKDRKISGTLIETTISGKMIQDCIFGIGINVNQQTFVSDAPNPVSLCHIIGREENRNVLLMRFLDELEVYLQRAYADSDEIVIQYNNALYHKQGWHAYEDADGLFEAEIVEVLPCGYIVLCDREGRKRTYELKEVRFVL